MTDNRPNLPVGAIEQAALRMTADERKMLVQRALSVRSTQAFKGKFARSEAYDE